MQAQYTPAEVFDLRCEFEVPRFLDLTQIDKLAQPEDEYFLMGAYDTELALLREVTQEEEFFQWF